MSIMGTVSGLKGHVAEGVRAVPSVTIKAVANQQDPTSRPTPG